jgi:hypothetical protein
MADNVSAHLSETRYWFRVKVKRIVRHRLSQDIQRFLCKEPNFIWGQRR